jgi:hypothetical protein
MEGVMQISVPLSDFTDHLAAVKAKQILWVNLNEVAWLVTNFKFDDATAIYDPEDERTTSDIAFIAFWRKLSRN